MEFFRDAYSVRLYAHTGKYLWASEDRKSVAQKKGKDTYGVIWRVELVPEKNTIRLKSVYDLYLYASDYAFLLGATGKKVQQSFASKTDSSLEWEPVSAGTYVKLRTKGDKFLRANGGMPPYRNSITHDVPVFASNQNVVLWEVEVVRTKEAASLPPSRMLSPRVSNASRPNTSPPPNASPPPPPQPQPQGESSSDDDDVSVPANIPKHRTRSNPAPRKIEIPPTYSSSPSESASPITSPLRQRRAAPPEQSPPPRRRDSPPSEPVRNVAQRRHPRHNTSYDEIPPPRRRAADADFDQSPPPRRRAADAAFDQSPPPRRGAADAAYDQSPPPRRRAADTAYDQSPPPPRRAPRDDYDSAAWEPRRQQHDDYDSLSPAARRSPRPVDYEHSETSSRSGREKVKSPDIRRIFYSVAEDDGQVLAHDVGSYGDFMFKGHGLEELTSELQRVTGIHEDIILCMKNPISEKLYKMRLALPPNKAPLSVVIVRSNSQFGRAFSAQTSRQR